MIRGIQILGLFVALVVFVFIIIAKRRGRIGGRFFLFWMLFWGLFTFLDLFPSVVVYVLPVLDLQTNMYALTAGSILTLFVLVFVLYSFLTDLNRKVAELTRQQAIVDNRVRKMLEVMDCDPKKDCDSDSSS